MSTQVERVSVSVGTLRIAHEALIRMGQAVHPWAEMEGEGNAQRVAEQIREACRELKEAING